MSCRKINVYFQDNPRAVGNLLIDSTELSEHLVGCTECRRFVLEQRELVRSLQALRSTVPAISSSLDHAVLLNYQLYRANQSRSLVSVPCTSGTSVRRLSGWATALAVACLVVSTGDIAREQEWRNRSLGKQESVSHAPEATHVGRRRAGAQRSGANKRRTMAASAEKTAHLASVAKSARFPTAFQSLMFCDQLSCPGAMDVIRLELPSPVLGMIPPSARTRGVVSADVLVGPDGIVRGIRMVE